MLKEPRRFWRCWFERGRGKRIFVPSPTLATRPFIPVSFPDSTRRVERLGVQALGKGGRVAPVNVGRDRRTRAPAQRAEERPSHRSRIRERVLPLASLFFFQEAAGARRGGHSRGVGTRPGWAGRCPGAHHGPLRTRDTGRGARVSVSVCEYECGVPRKTRPGPRESVHQSFRTRGRLPSSFFNCDPPPIRAVLGSYPPPLGERVRDVRTQNWGTKG